MTVVSSTNKEIEIANLFFLLWYHIGLGAIPSKLGFFMENLQIRLENQMACIVPFGKFLKLWASGQSDVVFLLHLGIIFQLMLIHFVCCPTSDQTN